MQAKMLLLPIPNINMQGAI